MGTESMRATRPAIFLYLYCNSDINSIQLGLNKYDPRRAEGEDVL